MRSITAFSLLALLSSTTALAGSHHTRDRRARRHGELAEKQEGLIERDASANSTLVKRDSFTGRGTFYYTGLGACGQNSQDSDYMVALNSAQYGGGYPGPQCFKGITIQANGVTVGGVTILDECPTCDWGGLDLSPGLFQRFASLDTGTIQLTWWFDGDSGPQTTQQPSPTPSPSPPPPTSTWTPPPSTQQWQPPSSTWSPSPSPWIAPSSSSSSSSSSSTPSSTWVAPSSSSTPPPSSSSTAPSSTENPFAVVSSASASASIEGGVIVSAQSGNLEALNGLVAAYGQIIVVGGGGYDNH